jgi:hypothetical protein
VEVGDGSVDGPVDVCHVKKGLTGEAKAFGFPPRPLDAIHLSRVIDKRGSHSVVGHFEFATH